MTEAHYLSMLVMGIGSFLFGMLPLGFSLRNNTSYSLFLSLILCLGAGVLLATSLIHMLTEVQTKLKLTAQLYFCAGFLILYAFDEVTHFCLGSRKSEREINSTFRGVQRKSRDEKSSYGTDRLSEKSYLLESNNECKPSTSNKDNNGFKQSSRNLQFSYTEICGEEICPEVPSSSQHCQEQIRCHMEIGEPCSSNPIAKTGLLIALLIHSILEGISIGVQTEVSQILLILGAVSFHKIVLSFCLGLELYSSGYKNFNFIVAIFLFSIGSPIGIFVGMSVTTSSHVFHMDAQLQAIAAGSLLYVAAFEVLPRERFKWQHKSSLRAAGIFQLAFVLMGFACITLMHLYIVPGHDV